MRVAIRRTLAAVIAAAALRAQNEGPVTIGGVTYERVDPGEPFTPAPPLVQDWAAPEPSKTEVAAGMMAFIAPDPGEYRPDRLPRATEQTTALRAFLTPGEDEPVCFGIRSLAALAGLTLSVEMTDMPVAVDIRQAHCWPQRTGWRSRQWYVNPGTAAALRQRPEDGPTAPRCSAGGALRPRRRSDAGLLADPDGAG